MAPAPDILPISGYVLAGGKSSRMGVDKAALMFHGRPLVELAVERLARFCAQVAIAGNRVELAHIATIATEKRESEGPGAGVETGLRHALNHWCLFTPVDVPLLPMELLRMWAVDVLEADGGRMRASYLKANGRAQPSICMVHRDGLDPFVRSLNRGERRLRCLLEGIELDLGAGTLGVRDAAVYAAATGATSEDVERWFLNLNTPEDLAQAKPTAAG